MSAEVCKDLLQVEGLKTSANRTALGGWGVILPEVRWEVLEDVLSPSTCSESLQTSVDICDSVMF